MLEIELEPINKIQKCLGNDNKIIVIGHYPRKFLNKLYFGEYPFDLTENDPLDILIECEPKKLNEIAEKFNLENKNFSYHGIIEGYPVALLGYVLEDNSFDILNQNNNIRPDCTIERLGYYADGEKYDFYKTGFSDFENRLIKINTDATMVLFPAKVIKYLELKEQLDFKIEEDSLNFVNNYLKSLDSSLNNNWDWHKNTTKNALNNFYLRAKDINHANYTIHNTFNKYLEITLKMLDITLEEFK